MITILGIRRIILFAVLLLISAGAGYGAFYYLQPENEKLERNIRSIQGETSKHWKQADAYTSDYNEILELDEKYQRIMNINLVSTQNRSDATALMDEINIVTDIKGQYDIGQGKIIRDEQAEAAGYVILASPVKISMQSLDDLSVYEYIYWLENTIPGYASFDSFVFERVMPFNDSLLKKVGNGTDVPMIQGDIGFNWLTLVSREFVDEDG